MRSLPNYYFSLNLRCLEPLDVLGNYYLLLLRLGLLDLDEPWGLLVALIMLLLK